MHLTLKDPHLEMREYSENSGGMNWVKKSVKIFGNMGKSEKIGQEYMY